MKQALLPILIVAAVLLLAGGCGRREVEDTAFVLALGFDKAPDGQFSITSQVAIPAKAKESGGGGGDLPVMVVTNTGRTVTEAVQKFALSSNKEPFWGHVRVAVFGEALARDGILPVLDFLARSHESRVLMWALVTPGLARDILATESKTENLPAMYLSGLVDEAEFHSLAPQTTLFDTVLSVGARTGDPLLPMIVRTQPVEQVKPGESGGASPTGLAGGGGKAGGGGASEGGSANPTSLQGAGVFRDDKLVGWLDPEETRGALWLRGDVRNTLVDFGASATGPNGAVRVFLARRSVDTIVDPSDLSRCRFRITIHANAYLIEYLGGPDVSQARGQAEIEAAIAATIRQEAEQALRRIQTEFQADVLELGELVRERLSNAAWEMVKDTWFDSFPEVQVEVAVDFKLRRPGLLNGRIGLGRR